MAHQTRKAQENKRPIQRRDNPKPSKQEKIGFGQSNKRSFGLGAKDGSDRRRPVVPIVGSILWGG